MTGPPRRRGWARAWPWLRYAVGLALAGFAAWALAGRTGELSGASTYLAHIRWWWLALAVVAEAGSLTSFAIVQRRLLQAGRVNASTLRLTGVTVAATAIANSMPAGAVVSSVFAFRQYRHQGADEALAWWTLVAVFVSASVTLALVAAVGVAIAGAEGAGLDLVGVTVGVLIGALVMGAVFLQRRALVWVVSAVVRVTRRLVGWPRGELGVHIDTVISRLTAVTLTVHQALSTVFWGVANWILDCSCLALSFMAVGVGVPWKGLLLAYGAGQLAANLPITPGGLGVVEGSLTIALVAFGGAETSTVAAVLLYRILSFWAELPVGWTTWALMTWMAKRPLVEPATATPAAIGEPVAS
ncbi:MAG TPA: YbhN family protein [Acidimicrobiales bacterium]|nr:YbhN family protein [Acidimicrobiales bacterium]